MGFAKWHPANGLLYFTIVIGGTMLTSHPLLLFASLFGASAYTLYRKGARAWARWNWAILPILAFFSVFNAYFNHQGVTVLAYVRDNPVTVEAIVYGLVAGLRMAAVLLWFSVYHALMGSEQWTALLGGVLPTLSLLLCMSLRMTPEMASRAKAIHVARKGLARREGVKGTDSLPKRLCGAIRCGKEETLSLTAWSLENAMETAITMKSRGYGLKRRSSYTNLRMKGSDYRSLAVLLVCLAVQMVGAVRGGLLVLYFPKIRIPKMEYATWVYLLIWVFFVHVPLLADAWEGFKWRCIRLRS